MAKTVGKLSSEQIRAQIISKFVLEVDREILDLQGNSAIRSALRNFVQLAVEIHAQSTSSDTDKSMPER